MRCSARPRDDLDPVERAPAELRRLPRSDFDQLARRALGLERDRVERREFVVGAAGGGPLAPTQVAAAPVSSSP